MLADASLTSVLRGLISNICSSRFRVVLEPAHAMKVDDKEQSFAFMKLPDLVQYIILTQTDLVPNGSVPIQITSRSRVCPDDQSIGPRKSTTPSNHTSLCVCQLCAVQPPTDLCSATGSPSREWDRGTPKTVCSRWSFPISIFLVSRQVNTLARSVFFSQNTFLIWDNSRPPSRAVGGIVRSEFVYLDLTLRKLRQMPLASFRWLEFRVESSRALENKKDGISYKLWHELAELINNAKLAGRLTLVIDFSYLNSEYTGSNDDPEDIWEADQNIAGDFKQKETLFKDFFMHLASPGLSYYEDDIVRWNRERKLERLVMNNKDYDSALRGKYRQRWLDESSGPRMHFRHFLRSVDLSFLDDRDEEVRQGILDESIIEQYSDFDFIGFYGRADHT